jgi:Tfp pilus assembly protein PilE
MAAAPKKKSSTGWIIAIVIAVLAIPACIGISAVIAIPAFLDYTQGSKTAEAESQLSNLYQLTAGYYANESWANRGEPAAATNCTVASARTTNTPAAHKTVIDWMSQPASFEHLGFSIADPVYYQYEIIGDGTCGHGPNSELYTLRAIGDLDGDGEQSSFSMSVRSNAQNELEHGEIVRENELE